MKISDLLNEVQETKGKQRLDPKCWKGKKIGNPKTKVKGGVRVNNCVPKESVSEGAKVDRQAKHITQSMMKKGKSKKDAEAIAWAHIKHPKKATEATSKWDYDPFKDGSKHGNDQAALKNWVIELWNSGKDVDLIAAEIEAPLEVVKDIVDEYESDSFDGPDNSDYAKDYDLDEGPFTGLGKSLMKHKLEKDIKQHGRDLDNDSKKYWLSGSGLPPWHPDEYQDPQDPTFDWDKTVDLRDRKAAILARLNKLKEDWQKVNKKDKTDGMSRKAVKAYRREHPGSKLKTAVTTKPSKLKKGSKASKRRKSFCARSNGQKKMHHIDCSKTPDKAICKARRRWNCEE